MRRISRLALYSVGHVAGASTRVAVVKDKGKVAHSQQRPLTAL